MSFKTVLRMIKTRHDLQHTLKKPRAFSLIGPHRPDLATGFYKISAYLSRLHKYPTLMIPPQLYCKIFFKTLKENSAIVENRISGNEYTHRHVSVDFFGFSNKL